MNLLAFILWANAGMGDIEDVKGYNRTLSILQCGLNPSIVRKND